MTTKLQRAIIKEKKKTMHKARVELAARLPSHSRAEVMSGEYDKGPAMRKVLADMAVVNRNTK